jgi:hypothetical protein
MFRRYADERASIADLFRWLTGYPGLNLDKPSLPGEDI